jgi:hypothetical protein
MTIGIDRSHQSDSASGVARTMSTRYLVLSRAIH